MGDEVKQTLDVVKQKLLESCRKLNNQDIISNGDYEKCLNLYGSNKLNIDIENDIFKNRNTINNNYEKYLIYVKKFIDTKFKDYISNQDKQSIDEQDELRKYWNPLIKNIKNVTNDLKNIGENYHSKENKNYKELVNKYNIIENNTKYIDDLNSDLNTLEKRKLNYETRLENTNNNILTVCVIILLIVMLILIGFIVKMKFFNKA